jgi:hypothetical protein
MLTMAVAAHAQRPMTVAQVTEFIKSQIKTKGEDRLTADYLLHKIKLTEKLEDRSVEELQGLGAGPKTVAALRKLSEESASLQAAPPPQAPPPPPPPPPPPDSVEQAEAMHGMTEYALNYTKSLPNYMCVQTTKRNQDPTGSGRQYRPYGDEIRELLTFFDRKETYKVEMINGRSVANVDHRQLGGVVSEGEFGTMLYNIFEPGHEAEIEWERWSTLRGRRMYVFSFKIDKSHGYSMYHQESKREYVSAYRGEIFADQETKAIMRIKMECVGIPADYPIKQVAITLDYKPTKISDQEFVLPFHFELDSAETRAKMKNEASYALYRKFGSEATIKFGDIEPIPEDQLKEQETPKPPVKKQP